MLFVKTFFNIDLLIENRLDDRRDSCKRSAENYSENQQIKNRRIGKDDKLAKEAKLPFTVRVRTICTRCQFKNEEEKGLQCFQFIL